MNNNFYGNKTGDRYQLATETDADNDFDTLPVLTTALVFFVLLSIAALSLGGLFYVCQATYLNGLVQAGVFLSYCVTSHYVLRTCVPRFIGSFLR